MPLAVSNSYHLQVKQKLPPAPLHPQCHCRAQFNQRNWVFLASRAYWTPHRRWDTKPDAINLLLWWTECRSGPWSTSFNFFLKLFLPFNSELKLKVQTKAALKGWSALTGDKTGSTAQSTGPKKVETFHLRIKISSEAFSLSKKWSWVHTWWNQFVCVCRCQLMRPLPSFGKPQRRRRKKNAGWKSSRWVNL